MVIARSFYRLSINSYLLISLAYLCNYETPTDRQ